MNIRVDETTLSIISAAKITGNTLALAGQLDRKTYMSVAKVIEAAGGKWNRKAGAHVFDRPADEALDQLFQTGEISNTKQDLGQFDSPSPVVARLIELARIAPGMKAYEPSAGIGNIVGALRAVGADVSGNEMDPVRHAKCLSKHFPSGGLTQQDFLSIEPHPMFDRVVMNPPFAKGADVRHVIHAAKFLKPGGRLVSVMGAGIRFRDDKPYSVFRSYLEFMHGQIEALPAGSFKESGTGVNAVIVSFNEDGS